MKQRPEKLEDMQQLVLAIARALVDIPDAVVVDARVAGETTTLSLRVAPEEVGKVIGKQGRLAQSIRVLLGAVGMKHQHRYTLHILQDHDVETSTEERGEEAFPGGRNR
jgi:predicted RNA-binding protein YlqC (UPF0109 family)